MFHLIITVTEQVLWLGFIGFALAACFQFFKKLLGKSKNGLFGLRVTQASCLLLLLFTMNIFLGSSLKLGRMFIYDHDQYAIIRAEESKSTELAEKAEKAKVLVEQNKEQAEKLVPLCQWAAGQKSKYPSKAKTGWHGYQIYYQQPNGEYWNYMNPKVTSFSELKTRIKGTIEFMNGFGAYIPHKYQCDFKGDQIEAVRVVEGG